LEPGEALVFTLVGNALAGEGLAEVGMTEADGLAHESGAAAARAEFFVLFEGGVRGRFGR
jgi:hypothetical protein